MAHSSIVTTMKFYINSIDANKEKLLVPKASKDSIVGGVRV